MGICGGKQSEEARAQAENNKRIERELAKGKRSLAREVKLLLLGTGSSGKSTIAKQMHILYLNGFGDKEREEYKKLIAINLLENMQHLIKAAHKFNYDFTKHEDIARELLDLDAKEESYPGNWSATIADKIATLWNDEKAIKDTYARQSEFYISDSAGYFFTKVAAFKDLADYVPNEEDILRVRKKTTGVVETTFTIAELVFRMVDVGGQRNERRKWIHCFEDVTAIIFVASLSEYDQNLEEDEHTNRMKESLHLFEETVNNDWFRRTPILLFLNKHDLFLEKIQRVDLGNYLNEYRGGKDADKARKYIQNSYAQNNHSNKNERQLYIHCTTATDTKNIMTVFDAVQDIFLAAAFKEFSI